MRSLLLPLALLAASACISLDEPHPLPAPGSTARRRWLSEMGVFADLPRQLPAPGFVPFRPTVSLYSDGAEKHRWVYLPPGETLHVTDDRWELPVGAYVVKTFSFPVDARRPEAGHRLIETRFLVRTKQGFEFSTYLWNDAQDDAEVSGGNVDVPVSWIDQEGLAQAETFHVPGTSQCQTCHFDRALGLRSPEMDRAEAFEDGTTNQLEHLLLIGLLDALPPTRAGWPNPFHPEAPLDLRARAYLAMNCGPCHSTGGDEEATVNGVRWDFADTEPAQLPLCKPTPRVAGRDRVIVPGHPEQSELIARMNASDPFVRMPRGPTHTPDRAGIALLSEWIASMPAEECP